MTCGGLLTPVRRHGCSVGLVMLISGSYCLPRGVPMRAISSRHSICKYANKCSFYHAMRTIMVFGAAILSGAPLRRRLCFSSQLLPMKLDSRLRHLGTHEIAALSARGPWGPLEKKKAVGNIDLMALAQHHGIPTRLLDWSMNPMTAAFFAASPTFRPETSKSVCVWALNRNDVQRSNEEGNPQRKLRVVIHEPARGNNRYLHAQGGIFTEVTAVQEFFFQNDRWPSLEDVFSGEAATQSRLIGHSLNSNEVPRLLQLLDREGMNLAALMPSLDKVAETVIARWNYAGVPLPSVGGP